MDGDAGIGVSIFGLIGGPELCFIEKDPGPPCLGNAREDAGEFLQVGGDSLAECSDFFTGGHGIDSVGTGFDGEAGPDGQDVWGREIHLGMVL